MRSKRRSKQTKQSIPDKRRGIWVPSPTLPAYTQNVMNDQAETTETDLIQLVTNVLIKSAVAFPFADVAITRTLSPG
jgi:hypothetical protein